MVLRTLFFHMKKIKLLSWLQGKPHMRVICVHRMIIIAVPFDSLKNNGVAATEL